jgi:uncharacterized protein YecE (DUF72 family)
MPQVRIGISGWRYVPWRGTFYPKKLTQDKELYFASRALNSIEINGSFYSLQWPSSYRKWYDETPDGFVFSVKGGRFITHMKRLRDIDEPLANFFASGVLLLKEKLGPILWQFPPNFQFEEERFAHFLEILPRDTTAAAKLAKKHAKKMKKSRVWTETDARRPLRHAFEIRHPSFRDERFFKLLRKHNAALVLADTAKKVIYIEESTADFVYARLHGDEELYVSGYTPQALDQWAAKLKRLASGGRDTYVYFDNDVKVHAPYDAMSLSQRLGVGVDFEEVKRQIAPTGRPKKQREKARPKWPR